MGGVDLASVVPHGWGPGFLLCKPHKKLVFFCEGFLWIILCIVWPGGPEARRAQGRPPSTGIWSLHCSVQARVFWPRGTVKISIIHSGFCSGGFTVERVVDSMWFRWSHSTFFNFSYTCIKHTYRMKAFIPWQYHTNKFWGCKGWKWVWFYPHLHNSEQHSSVHDLKTLN